MQSDKEKLEQLMLAQNLNQTKLSKITGVKQQVISRLLTSKNEDEKATPALKFALLKYFSYDIDSGYYTAEVTVDYGENIISIPFYTAKAAAGKGIELPDYEEKDVIHFDKRWLQAVVGHNPENLSLIQAEGDSMSPDIQDGDLLMVDTAIKEVIPNKIFIIKQNGQYRVKKLKTDFNGDIMIISINHNYPTEVMNQETEIIGQVVWNGSKDNI